MLDEALAYSLADIYRIDVMIAPQYFFQSIFVPPPWAPKRGQTSLAIYSVWRLPPFCVSKHREAVILSEDKNGSEFHFLGPESVPLLIERGFPYCVVSCLFTGYCISHDVNINKHAKK